MALDGNFCRSLRDGLLTSFVDASVASEQNLRAQLLANDMSGSGTKVISVLEQELLRCQKFDFSVAFITMGGITPLLQTFKELEARGIKGRILTTNYLMFTDPRALEKLAGLSNIEIKFFRAEEAGQTGFHTKGYIFDRGRLRSIIVGSSNLTQTALTVNQEWNARLVSAAEGEFARQIQTEFMPYGNIQPLTHSKAYSTTTESSTNKPEQYAERFSRTNRHSLANSPTRKSVRTPCKSASRTIF